MVGSSERYSIFTTASPSPGSGTGSSTTSNDSSVNISTGRCASRIFRLTGMGGAYAGPMSGSPSNLRADTVLTPDAEVTGRFHADIPDAWKVVYVFGGVSM